MRLVVKKLEYWLASMSGSALLLGVLALAIVPGIVLSVQQINKARDNDVARLTNIVDQVVGEIDRLGFAQGINTIKGRKEIWQDEFNDLSLRLSLLTDNGEVQYSNVYGPAFGESARAREDHSVRWYRGEDGRRYRIVTRDITDIPAEREYLVTPFILQAATILPERAERQTWRRLSWIWLAYASVVLIAILLYWHTNARLRRGINAISATLDRFADGDTGARIGLVQGAPETQALTNRLDPILGRLDRNISGMKLFAQKARHEICNPLIKARNVLSEASIGENTDEAAQVRKHLLQAERNVGAILRLLKLDAERGETATPALIDLSQLVTDCVELAEAGLIRDGYRLETNIAPDFFLRASAEHMAMLVGNLLENARKYARPSAQITVQLSRQGDHFRLTVANTGAFPADIRETAFDPFSRAKSVQNVDGSGLGLALVDRIAERYGLKAFITPSNDIAEVVITGPVSDAGVVDEMPVHNGQSPNRSGGVGLQSTQGYNNGLV